MKTSKEDGKNVQGPEKRGKEPRKKKPEPKEDKPESKRKANAQRNEKGQFTKGNSSGGRKPGSKNKYGNIRDRLKDIIMPYLDYDPEDETVPDGSTGGKKVKSFATDLVAIGDPKDRIDAVAKILPFIIPKYTSTTISADANRPISEEEQLLELDQQYTKKEISINIKALTIVDNDNPQAASGNNISNLAADYDPDDDPDFNIDEL